MSDPATVSILLDAVRDGRDGALNELLPLVYDQLYVQARHHRRQWQGNMTVNTTALVHEAYLKLVDQTQMQWDSRAHFMAVASKAMRHILIDYAKHSQRKKRGGDVQKVSLDVLHADPAANMDHLFPGLEARADELLALEGALEHLARLSERQCQVVECRFFGGMTIHETAQALDISPATVKRDWLLAQAWLYREINSKTDA